MANKMKMRDKFSRPKREARSLEGKGKEKLFAIKVGQLPVQCGVVVFHFLDSSRLNSMLVKRFAIFNFSLVYPFAIVVNSESRFAARFLCGPNVQLPLAKISRKKWANTPCNRHWESETPAEATAVIRYLLRQVQSGLPTYHPPTRRNKKVLINGFTCDTYLFAWPRVEVGGKQLCGLLAYWFDSRRYIRPSIFSCS